MTGIKIHKASLDDVSDIANCAHALFRELGMGDAIPEPSEMAEKCSKMLRNDPAFHAFIARNNLGKIIGLLTLHETDALFAKASFVEIMEFYVAPDFRSQGVGKRLLDRVVVYSKEMNWSALTLNAPPQSSSPASIRFYEREGFTHKGPYMGKSLL